MIKKYFLQAMLFFLAVAANGQSPEAAVLMANAQIDEGVVKKDIAKLKTLYGDDFVFTHAGGHVDSKESWLKNIQSPDVKFISRQQDSTKAEMHGDVAILIGRVDIVRDQRQVVTKYGIWYVRVFARRKGQWQMISHRTTKEWH
jgi:ketosteroid isomerase-like protein